MRLLGAFYVREVKRLCYSSSILLVNLVVLPTEICAMPVGIREKCGPCDTETVQRPLDPVSNPALSAISDVTAFRGNSDLPNLFCLGHFLESFGDVFP